MCIQAYIKNYDFYESSFFENTNSLDFLNEQTYNIPDNTEVLSFMNCNLTNIKFPTNLKKLYIKNCYEYKKNIYYNIYKFFLFSNNYIPIFMKIIKFFHKILKKSITNLNLPNSVEYLEISSDCHIKEYPDTLKKLEVMPCFRDVDFNTNTNFPNSLTHLTLSDMEVHNLTLPLNLMHLNLCRCDCTIIYNKLLKNLNTIKSQNFNFSNIPQHVINIGIDSNNASINNLPQHIKRIRLYVDNTTDIVHNLPILLKKLYIDYYICNFYDGEHRIDIKKPFNCIIEELF